MFLELIATIFAGLAGAGLVFLLNIGLGGRLPKWLAPVAAGAAMILATITSEYGWYERNAANLPEGVIVAETHEARAIYRPWTYVKPYVDRFVAVDVANARTNAAAPDQAIVDLYMFGRWAPTESLAIAVDCAALARAPLASVEFAETGQITSAAWVAPETEDGVISTTCEAI